MAIAFLLGGCPEGPDQDNDGVVDAVDNCPTDANVDQADSDSDGLGDACGDCPEVANAGADANENGNDDACGVGPARAFVESTFADGDEGWRLGGAEYTAPLAPSWSEEEQYVFAEGVKVAYWIAPQEFRGDFSPAYGTALEYECAWVDGGSTTHPRIVLAGGGITLNHQPDYDPEPWGSHFWVWLDEAEAWFDAGTNHRATAEQIRAVLADISQLQILAGNSATSWITYVAIGADSAHGALPVTFDFTSSDEGWRLAGGSFSTITRGAHDADNGWLTILGARFGKWRSPRSLRGDFGGAYGKRLVVDHSWEERNSTTRARIQIYGGGFVASINFGADPGPTIGSFGVMLDETGAWSISGDNERPTRDQFLAILENFQGIRILAGRNGESRLDRVVFGGE